METSRLALVLFTGLCLAEELTIAQPSANILLYGSGEHVMYSFNVLADNSRLEFRVTLTESPKDSLDVYLRYDQPINVSTPELSDYAVTSGPVVASTSNEGGFDCQVGRQCMIYVLSLSPCVVKAGTYHALVIGSSDQTTKGKARFEESSAELEPNVPVSRYVSYHEPASRRWHFFALTPSADAGAHATPPRAIALCSPVATPLPLCPLPPPSCYCSPPVSARGRSCRAQPHHLRQLRPPLHGALRR